MEDSILIIDFHNDTYLKITQTKKLFQSTSSLLQINYTNLISSGVSGLFFSIWSNPTSDGELAKIKTIAHMHELKKTFKLIPEEYLKFISIEGGFALNNDPNNISEFKQHGLKKLTLTHFSGPDWAGSEKEQSRGLNSLGAEIIMTLNEYGIIVDVAHASEKTMLDAIKVSKKPIVYSHGGVQKLNPISRCISDLAIEGICKNGGVIGISFFPDHLTSNLKHNRSEMEHFWKKYQKINSNHRLTDEKKLSFETKLLLLNIHGLMKYQA